MKPRMLVITIAIIGALSIASAAAYAAKATSAQDFVTKASIAGKFEIDSSKLALSKSQNNDVKTFADAMVSDHTKASAKLKDALAASKSGAVASENLDSKHQKIIDKLNGLSGADFDKEYVSVQLDAHKEAVSLFDNYSKHGKDNSLKNFAASTLPTLQGHLDHVKNLKDSVK